VLSARKPSPDGELNPVRLSGSFSVSEKALDAAKRNISKSEYKRADIFDPSPG
jgi:hypothetical protein